MSHSPGIVNQTPRSIRSVHCPHFTVNSRILIQRYHTCQPIQRFIWLHVKFTKLADHSQRFLLSQRLERSRPIRTPYSPVAARDAGPPARAREDTPRAGGATGDACVDVTRVYPGRCAPIFASARSRRSGASARFVASEERGMLGSREARCTGRVKSAEGAMHGQGQKRRRRDARAG